MWIRLPSTVSAEHAAPSLFPSPPTLAGSSSANVDSYVSCRLRLSLLLAAFACMLRPTNGLVWLSLSLPTAYQASSRRRYVLVRELLLCG